MAKKVLCTLGPASLKPEIIKRLDELNVDLFRLNLSHTTVEEIEGLVNLVRSVSAVPICLDTQGAQIRTGAFVDGHVTLESGNVVELVAAPLQGNATTVPLYSSSVLPQLVVGDLIRIDFDAVPLQVVEVGKTCRARVLGAGTIGSNKAVSLDRAISLPELTDVDYAAIELGLRLGIRHVALSFTNRRQDIEVLRRLVGDQVHITAKIESRLGLENLTDILTIADAILIDRGDLAREVAIESLPFIQKDIIRRANNAQVPVYVATNLLESMVVNPRPTRAEANDVINTLLDGADGLVLAAEVAIGDYPVGCLSMIRALIRQYETQVKLPWSEVRPSSTWPLIAPHGDELIQRVVTGFDRGAVQSLLRLKVSRSALVDVKQIATGVFSPLDGFMGQEVLEGVLSGNRLPDGSVWPMPILLQLPPGQAFDYPKGETVALSTETDGDIEALLHVEECFAHDLEDLAIRWFDTADPDHPGVADLMRGSNRFVAGKVDLLAEALMHQQPYELTPAQARAVFEQRQWQKVVGFHTRNVPHRAHEYLQFTALANHQCDGIFIHPVTGTKKPGDFSGDIILSTYQLLIDQFYPPNKALLSGFGAYSRYAGPREAVFTALCRKNFGCSHFIVGRDHTGVGDYYAPEASQRLFDEIGDIGIQPVFFDEVYYCRRCMTHVERCEHGKEYSRRISGTQARGILSQGKLLPEWYLREPVSRLILEELKKGSEVFAS